MPAEDDGTAAHSRCQGSRFITVRADIFMQSELECLCVTALMPKVCSSSSPIVEKLKKLKLRPKSSTTPSLFPAKDLHILAAMPVLKPQATIRQTAAVYKTTDILRASVSFTLDLLTALLPDLQGSTLSPPAGQKSGGSTFQVPCNSCQLFKFLVGAVVHQHPTCIGINYKS